MNVPDFAARLRTDPEGVVDEYDLTEDERAKVLSGDQNELRYLEKEDEDATVFSFCRLAECPTKDAS